MKLFYLVGILLLGVLCKANEEDLQDITKNSDNISSDEEFINELKEVLEKKCVEQGGEDAFKNLQKVIEDVKTCVQAHLPKNTDELENLKNATEGPSDDLCTEKRTVIRECFNNGVVEALEKCSEPDEKFLPHFIFDAVESVLEYICADEEAFITKVFNSFECVFNVQENENITDTCNDNFRLLKTETPEDIKITKEEICEDLSSAKTCYGGLIEKHCPGSELKNLVVDLFGAVSSGCEKRHKRNLPLSFRF